MLSELILLHRKNQQPFEITTQNKGEMSLAEIESGWLALDTCLRRIRFGALNPSAESAPWLLQPGDEILSCEQAYRFMLEVICGLHSPLVGETEVLGQFKTAIARLQKSGEDSAGLRRILQYLNEDTKKIRERHLRDLGSQSYGSFLRREFKTVSDVHIIGAGQLSKEIMPWLYKDGKKITFHVRDVQKARSSLTDYPKVEILSLDATREPVLKGHVIIAAPVATEALAQYLKRAFAQVSHIYDLRANSSELGLLGIAATITLSEVFGHLSQSQSQIAERKALAMNEVAEITARRSQTVSSRPFGWDDVCA